MPVVYARDGARSTAWANTTYGNTTQVTITIPDLKAVARASMGEPETVDGNTATYRVPLLYPHKDCTVTIRRNTDDAVAASEAGMGSHHETLLKLDIDYLSTGAERELKSVRERLAEVSFDPDTGKEIPGVQGHARDVLLMREMNLRRSLQIDALVRNEALKVKAAAAAEEAERNARIEAKAKARAQEIAEAAAVESRARALAGKMEISR